MKYSFRNLRLKADSLYAIVSAWSDMKLLVSPQSARIINAGFSHEVAQAFSTLVMDWEASVLLPKEKLPLEIGLYDLILIKNSLYACREQHHYLLGDMDVVVEVATLEE